ncbi:hypothetical protein BZA05DRAFT_163532 [Tricharina praecox]|uniref:uncharacterized protein n=1 Tax=Tricharina praecox TaxID=43433 RepID=UPI00221EF499|nr:uncharacterized protein BZA05DRAFT_163532 [Tricharina praecox]KAI5856979.1 hypothetical protein BZA05DRAFT_163532 [Tricharina praecox]
MKRGLASSVVVNRRLESATSIVATSERRSCLPKISQSELAVLKTWTGRGRGQLARWGIHRQEGARTAGLCFRLRCLTVSGLDESRRLLLDARYRIAACLTCASQPDARVGTESAQRVPTRPHETNSCSLAAPGLIPMPIPLLILQGETLERGRQTDGRCDVIPAGTDPAHAGIHWRFRRPFFSLDVSMLDVPHPLDYWPQTGGCIYCLISAVCCMFPSSSS